jgi:DNA-binding Lrp family transcriptional regulator
MSVIGTRRERLGSADVSTTIELDEVDRRIVEVLAGNARLSTRAIARELGMSAGAISERILRLERNGVITGYHAAVDPSALGFGMLAIVALQTDQDPLLAQSLDRLMEIPEIEAIHVVTGRWDLVVEIRVRDQEDLRRVILEKLWKIPGFRHSETMMSLETRRHEGGWAARDEEREAQVR